MNRMMRYAAYAGVVFVLFSLKNFVVFFPRIFGITPLSTSLIYFIGLPIELSAIIIFYLGIKVLGEKTDTKLLTTMAYLSMLILVTYKLQILIANMFPGIRELSLLKLYILLNYLTITIFGVASIILGIAFIRLEPRIGLKASLAALSNITGGIMMATRIVPIIAMGIPTGDLSEPVALILLTIGYLTTVLSSIGSYVLIPAIIIETIILYLASKEF